MRYRPEPPDPDLYRATTIMLVGAVLIAVSLAMFSIPAGLLAAGIEAAVYGAVSDQRLRERKRTRRRGDAETRGKAETPRIASRQSRRRA
jgi:hypothetical protein